MKKEFNALVKPILKDLSKKQSSIKTARGKQMQKFRGEASSRG
jgi:hypothetical protein